MPDCHYHPDTPAHWQLNRPDDWAPTAVVTAAHDGPVPLCGVCVAEIRQHDPETADVLISRAT